MALFGSIMRDKLLRAGTILALFTLVSKLTALFRDRILASHFGASNQLDVYYSAFRIPDLVFHLLIFGAVSSALIPVFVEKYREDKLYAWRIIQNFMTMAFLATIVIGFIAGIFAGPLASLIAPGFSAADRQLLVLLLRIMLFSPVIFSISAVLGSVLQATERFVSYALAPIFYNLGIISGALWLSPVFQERGYEAIIGVACGVVLGALFHMIVRIPASVRAGFKFKAIFGFKDGGFQKVVKLMLPRTAGIGAHNFETLIINAFASLLGAGSIAMFNLANNLQFVPISVLGISMAIAVFPQLSSQASIQERFQFREKLNYVLRRTAAIVGIVAIAMLAGRNLIVKTVFQSGEFNLDNTQMTATLLGIFMFGVIAQSLVPIMSRAFYALQNTKTPVVIAISSIVLNLILALVFTFYLHWGINGLALSYVVAGNFNFFFLYLLFKKRYL
jgi:putative peptidoglycan lipid II flippase